MGRTPLRSKEHPMPQKSLFVAAAAVASVTGSITPVAHSAIIYQCRAPTPSAVWIINDLDESSSLTELPGTPQEREFESRVGDSITFAGTDRFVTSFSTRLLAFGGVNRGITANVELSIFENSGGLPGNLLWSGVTPGVTIPAQPSFGAVDAVFSPNMVLPDTVCFAVAFTSIVLVAGESRAFGVGTYSNPTVGSSPVTTIHQLSADNSWFVQDNSTLAGGIFRNVEARVEAIPGPATASCIAASVFLIGRRRR